jgi:hypothetical protein
MTTGLKIIRPTSVMWYPTAPFEARLLLEAAWSDDVTVFVLVAHASALTEHRATAFVTLVVPVTVRADRCGKMRRVDVERT